MTTVVLVDDHPLFRSALRALLESADIEVVAEAGTAAEALAAASAEPDIVVMDIGLPDDDGVATAARILERHPSTKVLLLTMFSDDVAVSRGLEVGISGYLVKESPPDEVLRAIEAVASGSMVLGSVVAGRVRLMASGVGRRGAAHVEDFPELSDRERQVLALVADGLSNAAIADRLGLSVKTVANYVSTVLARLQAPDREALREMVAARRTPAPKRPLA